MQAKIFWRMFFKIWKKWSKNMLSFHCVHFGKFAFISGCLFTCIQKLVSFMLMPTCCAAKQRKNVTSALWMACVICNYLWHTCKSSCWFFHLSVLVIYFVVGSVVVGILCDVLVSFYDCVWYILSPVGCYQWEDVMMVKLQNVDQAIFWQMEKL